MYPTGTRRVEYQDGRIQRLGELWGSHGNWRRCDALGAAEAVVPTRMGLLFVSVNA